MAPMVGASGGRAAASPDLPQSVGPPSPTPAADGILFAQAQATLARAEEAAARQRLAQAEQAAAFWERLAAQLPLGRPAATLLLLRQEDGYLRRLQEAGDPLAAFLEALRAAAERQARSQAAAFERTFPAALAAAGIALDATSRHPRYTSQDGFLRLEVDERAFTVVVASRDGGELLLGMDVEPLVEAVQRVVTRLFDRALDPEGFLRRLYCAYAAVLQAEGRAEGDAVPLRRVAGRLPGVPRRVAADEFNIDLARLIRSGHMVINGRRLQIHHTRQTRQGMLLQGLEQGGYVGLVSFEPDGGAPC